LLVVSPSGSLNECRPDRLGSGHASRFELAQSMERLFIQTYRYCLTHMIIVSRSVIRE
jgi:hypothetical protein